MEVPRDLTHSLEALMESLLTHIEEAFHIQLLLQEIEATIH